MGRCSTSVKVGFAGDYKDGEVTSSLNVSDHRRSPSITIAPFIDIGFHLSSFSRNGQRRGNSAAGV
jgi:hypothetical protein